MPNWTSKLFQYLTASKTSILEHSYTEHFVLTHIQWKKYEDTAYGTWHFCNVPSKQYPLHYKTQWTTVRCRGNKNLSRLLGMFNKKPPSELKLVGHKLSSRLWLVLFIASLAQLMRTQKRWTKHKFKTTVPYLYKHLQSTLKCSIKKARSYWAFQYECPVGLRNLTLSCSHVHFRTGYCFYLLGSEFPLLACFLNALKIAEHEEVKIMDVLHQSGLNHNMIWAQLCAGISGFFTARKPENYCKETISLINYNSNLTSLRVFASTCVSVSTTAAWTTLI